MYASGGCRAQAEQETGAGGTRRLEPQVIIVAAEAWLLFLVN
jgi:hypothetical protein